MTLQIFLAAQSIGLLTLVGSAYVIPNTSEKYLWAGISGSSRSLFQGSMLIGIFSYLYFIYFFSFAGGKKYFDLAPVAMNKITLFSLLFMLCSVIWAPATYFYSQAPSKPILTVIAIGLIGTALAAVAMYFTAENLGGIHPSLRIALALLIAHTLLGDAIIWFRGLYQTL